MRRVVVARVLGFLSFRPGEIALHHTGNRVGVRAMVAAGNFVPQK